MERPTGSLGNLLRSLASRRLFAGAKDYTRAVAAIVLFIQQLSKGARNMEDKEKKPKPQGLEEALMRELRYGGLDKDNLKDLVDIVAGIQKAGLQKIKAFPIGIPPLVDGLRVCGFVGAGEANRLLGELLLKTPRLNGVVVFPYGIPWPEIFRLDVDLGATVETRTINRF
jgi:hypothetical protein